MEIKIVACGKQGRSPEAELTKRYLGRLPWKTEIHEIAEPRRPDPGLIEKRLLQKIEGLKDGLLIALDENGKQFSSVEFSALINEARQTGVNQLTFIIGAADGLPASCLKLADRHIAFGRLTWPHMLVRPMLAEQLYRASSIISGHPYHRA